MCCSDAIMSDENAVPENNSIEAESEEEEEDYESEGGSEENYVITTRRDSSLVGRAYLMDIESSLVSLPLLARARAALGRSEFDVSFSWYCTAFDLDPSIVLSHAQVENEFATVVNCFAKLLSDENRTETALECLKKVRMLQIVLSGNTFSILNLSGFINIPEKS